MDVVAVPYVSCIKLRGFPILPPVVNAAHRKEMQKYKDLAICIEKRLLYSKRVSMDSGLGTATNCELVTGRDATISPQNNIEAVGNTTLNLSNLTDCSSNSDESDCSEGLVKCAQLNESNISASNVEFSCQSYIPVSDELVARSHADDYERKADSDVYQASEITLTPSVHSPGKKNDNGNQLDETFSSVAMSASTDLNQYVDTSLTSSTTSLLTGEQQESILPVSELLPLCVANLKLQHKSLISRNDCDFTIEESKPSQTTTNQGSEATDSTVCTEIAPPRLVRSNSYTLEAPSPVLLAHVEQVKRNCVSRDSLLPRRRSWTVPPDKDTSKFVFAVPRCVKNVPACKKVSTHKKLSSSLPSSTSSSPVKMRPAYASTDCVPYKLLPHSKCNKKTKASLSAATTPDCKSNSSSQSFDSSNRVSHSIETCDVQGSKDMRLLFVELQSKYEKEKAELLARQRQEQDEMEAMFQNQCEQLVATITSQCPQLLAAMQASVSPASTLQVVKTRNSPRGSPFRRQFMYTEAEHKAASIIEAAMRGYLVRRLMKTERVQSLKATILDTVKCALRLEQDCQKEVTPADVELHRGLITQLNAAIQEFHHLFFSTSVIERMDVIATDRLHLRRQASRTLSQCALSAATLKCLKRKSHNGSSVNSSRPSSSRSNVKVCLSSNGSSRGNSVASAPV